MRKSKEQEILDDIITLLADDISQNDLSKKERDILLVAKNQLEKKEYFPKIIDELRSYLTPLATGGKLSRGVGKLYLKIINGNYADKGLGRGMMFVWGGAH